MQFKTAFNRRLSLAQAPQFLFRKGDYRPGKSGIHPVGFNRRHFTAHHFPQSRYVRAARKQPAPRLVNTAYRGKFAIPVRLRLTQRLFPGGGGFLPPARRKQHIAAGKPRPYPQTVTVRGYRKPPRLVKQQQRRVIIAPVGLFITNIQLSFSLTAQIVHLPGVGRRSRAGGAHQTNKHRKRRF